MAQGRTRQPRTGEERFAAYLDGIAAVLGHASRAASARAYCTGLLLPGERKSVEPMAARLAPTRVQAKHQSLHHVVAQAEWDDAALLRAVREVVLPAIARHGPIRYWIVDDTGFPKRGKHSVGVARQYCGEDRKSTRLNSSHANISYAVFCLKKKTQIRCRSAASPLQSTQPLPPTCSYLVARVSSSSHCSPSFTSRLIVCRRSCPPHTHGCRV